MKNTSMLIEMHLIKLNSNGCLFKSNFQRSRRSVRFEDPLHAQQARTITVQKQQQRD